MDPTPGLSRTTSSKFQRYAHVKPEKPEVKLATFSSKLQWLTNTQTAPLQVNGCCTQTHFSTNLKP